MSEYIPLEIQVEILKRLPLKALIQFRSVSKPWKSLIDSPGFVVSYGVHNPQPDRFILRYKLSSHYPVGDRYLTLVDNDNDDGHSFVRQDFVFGPTITKAEPHTVRVVGSSHGLLCFEGYHPFVNAMVVLWNPSIRKSVGIQVPESMIVRPMKTCVISTGVDSFVGFGVCPATLDPTIVKIKCVHYQRKKKDMHPMSFRWNVQDMHPMSFRWNVQVFTLSTGTWSILSTNLPRKSIRLSGSQVVVGRFIYWVAFDRLDAGFGRSGSKSHPLIMSFDLTTKEFEEINLSDCFSNRLCRIQSISKLRESLVMLAYHELVGKDVCSLWMMMIERGVNRSFTKLYNINTPDLRINRILGFRKARELIMETQRHNAELEIYDPSSEAIDNLGIGGDGYSFFMCSYMETLLLVDQLDGFIYSSVTDHK